MPDGFDPREEIFKLRKEFQEYRAKNEERERWIQRFWRERITYISIIVGLVVGMVSIGIMMIR
jgi:hypothetical protein